MADPFESSRRKIARAEEHLADLKRKISDLGSDSPYERVMEPDPDNPNHEIHKLKLTKVLPPSLAEITGDIVQNLRNALDNAGYAIAVAFGSVDPKFTAFPFAGSVGQMANALGRAKDIPPQIHPLFCGFQPYPGGDDLLWALNEICITDKHKMLIPMDAGIVRAGVDVRGLGHFSMPDRHVWDRAKNEMVLLTFDPTVDFNYNFDFGIFVAFNEIKVVGGQPVLAVLNALGSKVESILLAIEAESRRLGIVK
jgi:hypothetical protein